MKRALTALGWLLAMVSLAGLVACGGGGGGSTGGGGGGLSNQLVITTASILPPALQGVSYTTTLSATGGTGALHWSIAPVAPTLLFVQGLTIDSNSGVLSGIPTFLGTGGFIATVTDSGSQPVSTVKNFTITGSQPMTRGSDQTYHEPEFSQASFTAGTPSGGAYPLTFSVAPGCLPSGLRMSSSGMVTGTVLTMGTSQCQVTVADSFSPPEVVTENLTLVVDPPPLAVADSLPSTIPLNRPFQGSVVAMGGVLPLHFALTSGKLPDGLNPIDPNTGQIAGTPNTAAGYDFEVTVTDSATPPAQRSETFFITVSAPLGRNDSVPNATLLEGNGSYSASISPYIDPPNGTPTAGDNDYYKLISLGGATVHVETTASRFNANNLLDTVMEIVDANGHRLSACRQPGDSGTTFVSDCMNDDISSTVTDSALDFQVPGPANVGTPFYVHVLDWRGDARPDMTYMLEVSGIVQPLAFANEPPPQPAAIGKPYSCSLGAVWGTPPATFSVISGALPPGITLPSNGACSGSATTLGTYSFVVQATDSGNPPQTVSKQFSIMVVIPVMITSTANWPDACVSQPYTFTAQNSGGAAPFNWQLTINGEGIFQNFITSGVFNFTPTNIGTFDGTVFLYDASGTNDTQQITLNVKQCP